MTDMGFGDWVQLIINILVGIGGLAGIAAMFTVSAQKQKIVSETGRNEAEANRVLADAQAKRVTTEVGLIDPYERVQARMARELDDLYLEVDRLKEYIELLASTLRGAGLTVPPMPPKRHNKGVVDNLRDHAE